MALLLFSTDLHDKFETEEELPVKLEEISQFLIEDKLFFNRNSEELGNMRFNILKPIYHRATMKYFHTQPITYIELREDWVSIIRQKCKGKKVYFFNPTNRYLMGKIQTLSDVCELEMLDTPRFILPESDIPLYKGAHGQTPFYGWVRAKYGILRGKKGEPYGGDLTYDTQNREGPYKNMEKDLPSEYESLEKEVPYIIEATDYVLKTIPHTDFISWKGGVSLKFPISRTGALQVAKQFIAKKIKSFGTYQDAILGTKDSFLFHSAMSPMLNIGLLTPKEIVHAILHYFFYKLSEKTRIKEIHNVEGFIRQIVGWREYCRYNYSKNERFSNTFGLKNKLSPKWYSGFDTEPVDLCIEKAFKYGYLHHTERLMICANYMLYFDTAPEEIYRWFMEFALDSYDWVMELNIYGMVCYSGMSDRDMPEAHNAFKPAFSKPYICGSNYLLKMSNIPRSVWCQKWDYKFWFFMDKHHEEIEKVYRLRPLVKFAKDRLIELHEFAL